MFCFIHIDTGFQRIEAGSGSEFPDLSAAKSAAIEKARDLLNREANRLQPIYPEFFVDISGKSGELLAMLSLRNVVFGAPVADRHRGLFGAVPYPWLRLSTDLAIRGTNQAYLRATFKDPDLIAGLDMFEAFPDNPGDREADGVKKLSASLHDVLRTRQPHWMAQQRYDVRGRSGAWHVRRWRPINVPVLDHNGEIAAIMHHVEDVTGPIRQVSKGGRDICWFSSP